MTPTPEPDNAEARSVQLPSPPGATSTGEHFWRSAEEWCELLDVRIVDPDGWRDVRAEDVVGGLLAFETAWKQRISREEFERRYAQSTVDPRGRKAWLLEQAAGEAARIEAAAEAEFSEHERTLHLRGSSDLLTLENAINGGQAGAKVWTCSVLVNPQGLPVWLHLAGQCSVDPEDVESPAYEVPGPDEVVDTFQRAGFLRPWHPQGVKLTLPEGFELNDVATPAVDLGPYPFVGVYQPHAFVDLTADLSSEQGVGRGPWPADPLRMSERGTPEGAHRIHDEAVKEHWRPRAVLEGRLEAARAALEAIGYFKAAELGPDIAPRITELGARITQLEGELEEARSDRPDRQVTQAELDELPTIDVRGVDRIHIDLLAMRKRWEHEVLVEFLEHLPEDGAQAVDYIAVLTGAMLKARP